MFKKASEEEISLAIRGGLVLNGLGDSELTTLEFESVVSPTVSQFKVSFSALHA